MTLNNNHLYLSGRQLTFLHQSAFRCRPNIGATHSSRIIECDTPDHPPSKMHNRRGPSVKKSPAWAKLAVETNQDKKRFKKACSYNI